MWIPSLTLRPVFFSVNVEALAQAENSEAKTVLSAMKSRRAEKRLAAQEAAQAAMFPEPDSQHHHRHLNNHHHHRRKRSSAGGVSLPPGEPSPLKQAQLLRQRKENAAALARAAADKKSSAGGDGDGQTMPEVAGGRGVRGDKFSSSREAARHLALQEASEGIGNLSNSDSFSDWARCAKVVVQ